MIINNNYFLIVLSYSGKAYVPALKKVNKPDKISKINYLQITMTGEPIKFNSFQVSFCIDAGVKLIPAVIDINGG